MKFNVNNYVAIQLTDFGKEILRKEHAEIFKNMDYPYIEPKEDADGWSKWQMHTLMYFFGKYTYNGGKLPFNTNIIIVE